MINKHGRSQFPSIKLDHLVYVELEGNNGGMMLSVSEEGFSFRAVTSVQRSGSVPFSFIINGNEKLEGYGKIEWTQDEGKVAGLQFTETSTEFKSALLRWLTQINAPIVPSDAKATVDPWIKQSRASGSNKSQVGESILDSERLAETQPEPAIDHRAPQGRAEAHGEATTLPTNNSSALSSPLSFPANLGASAKPPALPMLRDWEYPKKFDEQPRANRVAVTAIVVCLVALALILFGYHQMVGQSLISLGEKISPAGKMSPAQPLQKPETPPPSSESATEKDRPVIPSDTAKSQNPTTLEPNPPTNAGVTAENEPPPTKTRTAAEPTSVSKAPIYRPSDTRPQDPAEQSRILWSAVAQGNTSAEVTLAKLYLIGGAGVPKSCDQARVLLQAAAKKGNTEAVDKLYQITRQGCP